MQVQRQANRSLQALKPFEVTHHRSVGSNEERSMAITQAVRFPSQAVLDVCGINGVLFSHCPTPISSGNENQPCTLSHFPLSAVNSAKREPNVVNHWIQVANDNQTKF